jgi:hypothetical protein
MKKQVVNIIGQVIGISLSVFFLSFVVFATGSWVGPTDTPPEGNLSAPLNSGSEAQFKEGALSVGGVFEALGIIVNPDGGEMPTCNESTRGMMWTERGGSGEQDVLYFCGKHADDTLDWTEYASMWKEITASGGDSVYTFAGEGTNGISGVTYRVHEFTTVSGGSFNVTDTGTDGEIEYIIVAGGGGGGGSASTSSMNLNGGMEGQE